MSASEPLVIAVAQPPVHALDVEANAAVHADVVRAVHARVVVFPELSLTGYELESDPLSTDDARLKPLVAACAAAGSVALAGAPVAGANGRPHIAMLAVDARGARVVYRKVWLGGAEPARFAPGPGPAYVEVDGWRLGLAICKDTGVPQHAADTAALGIDAYVAGLVEDEAGVVAERGRRVAVEHGVWVAFASCAAPTGGGFEVTAGGSAVWAPGGDVVAKAGRAAGEVAVARLRSPAPWPA